MSTVSALTSRPALVMYLGVAVAVAVVTSVIAFQAIPNQPYRTLNVTEDDVAIQGYDTVAYFTENKAIKGNSEFKHSWRLQGVEMVMLGYNTPTVNSQSDESPHLRMFHNHVTMQSGAYQNSTWVIGVAKAGNEDDNDLMGGSVIIAPTGEIVAQCRTLGDELIMADCDLDACAFGKETIFDFDAHRRIEHYGLITERTGAIPPPE